MGKKKANKGHGAEKTASKTEKKLTKKAKKELSAHGEEDVEAIIAEIAERDKKLNEVVIEKCGPPSPRSNMTFSLHPEKDELVMFGGEYFNGSKTFVYNDFYAYNIKKNEWFVIKVPNAPPPRCSHQAVSLKVGGGQLWVFGGEFASPTQSQFYHYRDLWVYHFRDHKWEKVSAGGGPSARSGHRMVAFRKLLVVFGGFHDNLRDYKYFNDVHVFDTETYRWLTVAPSGPPPAPRSACQLCVTPDQSRVILFGGYSKERLKKDVDKGRVHTDMFALSVVEGDVAKSEAAAQLRWKWQPLKQLGDCPPPRSGFSWAVAPGNRVVMFGGVCDEDEADEDVKSLFFNDLHVLDLSTIRWHGLHLRGEKDNTTGERKSRRRQKDVDVDPNEQPSADSKGEDVAEDVAMEEERDDSGEALEAANVPATTYDDGVFKVTIGPQSSRAFGTVGSGDGVNNEDMDQDAFALQPRMNAQMVVRNTTLYLYGGMYEQGDQQVTMDDFYTLDLQKLNEWSVISSGTYESQDWQGSVSGSSSGSEGEDDEGEISSEEGDDDNSGSSSEKDSSVVEPPAVNCNEPIQGYFARTKEFWLEEASSSQADEDDERRPANRLRQLAFDMAHAHFERCSDAAKK